MGVPQDEQQNQEEQEEQGPLLDAGGREYWLRFLDYEWLFPCASWFRFSIPVFTPVSDFCK
jgi:hypothetical protein